MSQLHFVLTPREYTVIILGSVFRSVSQIGCQSGGVGFILSDRNLRECSCCIRRAVFHASILTLFLKLVGVSSRGSLLAYLLLLLLLTYGSLLPAYGNAHSHYAQGKGQHYGCKHPSNDAHMPESQPTGVGGRGSGCGSQMAFEAICTYTMMNAHCYIIVISTY